MKWILVFFAIWNLAGALLRTFRILLEEWPLTRRLYPNKDMRPLDGISDLDLSPAAKGAYRAAAASLWGVAGRCFAPSGLIRYSADRGPVQTSSNPLT